MRESPDHEQREAWRRRIVEAVVSRSFDDETLAEMLMAGFDEAHAEGLLDAAEICGDVADGSPGGEGSFARAFAAVCLVARAARTIGGPPPSRTPCAIRWRY
jgi:hypothetical protein